jgi:integrase
LDRIVPMSNEAKRLAPAVLAEFNNIIDQARLRFERAACRDATLAELARLDTLNSDELMRQSPAVLDNLFQQLDLDPWQPPVKGSKVVPFRTIISEWAKERKVSPQGERSFTAKAAQDRERVLQAALASDHPLIKWANLLAGCQGMRLAEIVEADCRDVRCVAGGIETRRARSTRSPSCVTRTRSRSAAGHKQRAILTLDLGSSTTARCTTD